MRHCLLGNFLFLISLVSCPSALLQGFVGYAYWRMFEEEIIQRMWSQGLQLLLSALKIHPSFAKVEKFLSLDQFLLHLGIPLTLFLLAKISCIVGMFNTNNLNGALYPLHTHINHSCRPNAKAVDTRNKFSDVTGTSLPHPPSFGPPQPS
jgi:hypothetical protein